MEMKTVGIVTFYLNHNYGTSLQCYALKTAIERLGDYKVEIIPYTFVNGIENGFSGELLRNLYDKRINKFDKFLKNIIGCKERNIFEITKENTPVYDYYVAGSDTIWNTKQTGSDSAFFLAFAPRESKRIAYAPSLGVSDVNNLDLEMFSEYIDKFDFLSIREKNNIGFLQRFTQKKILSVVDPTLLLDADDYNKIAKEVINERYILVYWIYDDSESVSYVLNHANRLGIKYNMKVVHFIYNIPPYVFGTPEESFAFAGPEEFLGYVKNASFVFTNSYHGTIFSILYRRLFYSFLRKNGNNKINELLIELHLEDRIMKPSLKLDDMMQEIDYDAVNICLQKRIKESKDFLYNALK